MDRQPHVRQFINTNSLAIHRESFADARIIYLSIENTIGELAGYIILVLEKRGSIEFRRVLIDESQRGIGQTAIVMMEEYCKQTLSSTRIWLDVYEDNEVGKYIYEKLGYNRFKVEMVGRRELYFYEKLL
ncbi:MAG: GNAT family N-acetyltransferase [Cocleimonas sp.]